MDNYNQKFIVKNVILFNQMKIIEHTDITGRRRELILRQYLYENSTYIVFIE